MFRHALLLTCLVPTACGLPSLASGDTAELRSEKLAVRVTGVSGGSGARRLLFQAMDGKGSPVTVASLEGVRLVLASTDEVTEHLVPFTDIQSGVDSLSLECAPFRDQTLRIRIALAPGGGHLRVQVEDDVALLSRIREVTLDYEFLPSGPVDETFLPHLQPGPDELVGDASFGMPLGFIRSGSAALAIAPDVALLNHERRMPQAMEMDLEPSPRLRHGLISHHRLDGPGDATFYTRRGAEPVVVQGESLHFAHELHVLATASRRSLGEISAGLWRGHSAAILSSGPLAVPLDQVSKAAFEDAIAEGWAELELGGTVAGTISSGAAGHLDLPGADAQFTAMQQNLRTAYGLQLFADRTGQPELHAKVVQMVDLLLGAPRRSGFFPAVVALDPETGDTPWRPAAAHPGALPDHFRALDTAWTGYWLLQLADRIPERRLAILAACGETARFLMTNQLASGAIPAYFDPSFLAPRSGPLYENGPESAGIALYLAEYGAKTGDTGALAASASALELLRIEGLENNRWTDAETVALSEELARDGDPRTGQWPRGSLSLIFAAHSALILAEARGDPAALELAEDLLDHLGLFQQLWSPNWMIPRLPGGVGATNLDARWSTGRQSMAAHVWLAGYVATGRRDYLQRGALALRAGLAMAPGDRHWGRGAACTTGELVRPLLGQGVVDLAGGFAEGLDALWFEDLEIEGQEVRFRLLSREDLGTARICVRNPEGPNSLSVVVNGETLGPYTPQQLAAGVEMPVQQVARLEFQPPSSIQHLAPWTPRARFEGPLSEGARVFVEINTSDRLLTEVEMERGEEPGTLEAPEPFTPVGLGLGETVEVRLVVLQGGRREVQPPVGFREIVLGELHCLDLGDDDEANLVHAGSSVLTRFSDGRENSRSLPGGGGSFTYRIPVEPEATRLRLSIHLQGGVRITCGPNLVHEDPPDSDAPVRELALQLGDRRLWREGGIDLTFAAADQSREGSLQVAKISYLAEGRVALPTEVGRREHQQVLEQTLRVLVVPVDLPDTPLDSSRESLRQVFFGGSDYRLTPEPVSRRTAGSAAELVAAMSGGLTSLEGEVAERLQLQQVGADLQQQADGGRAAIALSLDDVLRDAVGNGQDVVAVVHGRGPEPMIMDAQAIQGDTERPAVVFLPDRSQDGSFLPVGRALAAILGAHFEFDPMGGAEAGNFGELALTATGGGHIPTGPVGVNLERSGWVDRIVVAQREHPVVQLPILQEDRAYYVLPGVSVAGGDELLPGRGNLILEDRRGGPGEPGLTSQGGTLIYWHFPNYRPVLINADGDSVRPRFLRLSPRRNILETPFFPGSADPEQGDLFEGPISLDADSNPSLVAPQGELIWSVENLRPTGEGSSVEFLGATDPSPQPAEPSSNGGRRSLSLRYHPLDLLALRDIGWSTGLRGETSAPLPPNGPDLGMGRVSTDGPGLVLTTRAEPGGTLSGLFPLFEEFDRNKVEAAEELLLYLEPRQDRNVRLSAIRSLENLGVASTVRVLRSYSEDDDAGVAAAARAAVEAIVQRAAEVRSRLPGVRPYRVLGNIAWTRGGTVDLRVGVGEQEYFRARLLPSEANQHLEVDLPAFPGERIGLLWLQLVHGDGPPASIQLSQLRVVPRERVWHRIQMSDSAAGATRWMDGGYHSEVLAMTVPGEGSIQNSTPLMLPEGPLMLRILAGLEYGAPSEQTIQVTIRLRRPDGLWVRTLVENLPLHRGAGPQPALTGLIDLPADRPEGIFFLDLSVQGDEGSTLHVQALEIVR